MALLTMALLTKALLTTALLTMAYEGSPHYSTTYDGTPYEGSPHYSTTYDVTPALLTMALLTRVWLGVATDEGGTD